MNQNRPDNERTTRIVTLDFNGGSHVYRNSELGMNIPVRIAPSGISADRARMLAEALNRNCADSHVRFEVGATSSENASAVRIGRTADFDRYGTFLGLAEGIGSGDAFVLLDDSASNSELVDVIRHEAGHILGSLDHGGAGLARYASYTITTNHHYGYSFDYPQEHLGGYEIYNVTFRELTPKSNMDKLILRYGEDSTTVEKRYWGHESGEIYESASPVVYNSVMEGYVHASGISLNSIEIYGGSATDCIADSITVSSMLTYSSVRHHYLGGFKGTRQEDSYTDVKSHRGQVSNCTVKSLEVNHDSIARNCTVNGSLLVRFGSTSNDGFSIYPGTFTPTAEYCTINGTLQVDLGGAAKKNIIKSGWAVVGGGNEDVIKDYDTAVVSDLIVEQGHVEVYNGGELHNATINGCLTAGAGAKLTGTIRCKEVEINCVPKTDIIIKVDLRDYAVANYMEQEMDSRHHVTRKVEYFANYTVRTSDYTYVYDSDGDVKDVSISVSYHAFTEADNERFRYYINNWEYIFYADFGHIYEANAASKIVLDFGGSEKEFDKGTVYLGVLGYKGGKIPFQVRGDERLWEGSETFVDVLGSPNTCFTYNAELIGEAMDVLWLENGWDEGTTYTVDLAPIMQGATENVTIIDQENGQETLPKAKIQGATLVLDGGVNTSDLKITAEDSNKRDLECDLELIVVPEEMPLFGKAGAQKYSQLLKKMQKDRTTSASDTFPNVHTKFFGMDFDLTNMGITLTVNWTKREMELKVQGKMEWKPAGAMAGSGKQVKLMIDLSGDNYISITHKGSGFSYSLVGEMKIPDFKIGRLAFSNMSLKVNTGNNSFYASALVQLPGVNYSFGGDIGIVDGCIDSLHISMGDLNVPFGSTGMMLQSKHLAAGGAGAAGQHIGACIQCRAVLECIAPRRSILQA